MIKFYSCAALVTLQALKLLRQQKVAQASLDKRETALDNLQNILHQIQMAETDAMVIYIITFTKQISRALDKLYRFTKPIRWELRH